MITRNNYSQEHIRELQASSKKDPALIERVQSRELGCLLFLKAELVLCCCWIIQ